MRTVHNISMNAPPSNGSSAASSRAVSESHTAVAAPTYSPTPGQTQARGHLVDEQKPTVASLGPTTSYRGNSRMTEVEENILNRVQLSTMAETQPTAPSTAQSSAPVSAKKPEPPGKKGGAGTEQKYPCDHCNRVYKTLANLRKHIADVHQQHSAQQATGKMNGCNSQSLSMFRTSTHPIRIFNIQPGPVAAGPATTFTAGCSRESLKKSFSCFRLLFKVSSSGFSLEFIVSKLISLFRAQAQSRRSKCSNATRRRRSSPHR